MRREADGDRLIAGTAPGWSITWAMAQVGKGVEVWAGALSRRIAADDPESARAFADAVVSTLQWGGTANLGGVKQVWEGIRSARKLATLRAFVAGASSSPT
ncbi:MAG: hypothetical protein IPN01_36055 [Deltaproteobacteria bacterium]|nr:hypothetical protein [Deltaproteobacteria bacterium]